MEEQTENDTNYFRLCIPGKGHSISSISVNYNEKFNMKIHPLYIENVDKEWEKKSLDCSNLFNATKFRLHHIELCHEEKSNFPNIKMSIGLTSYKDLIATNCAPYADKLISDGLKHYGNPQAYLADPIGVGGLLISADDDVIFIRRSKMCAEMPLLIDRPGGHPEPDEIATQADKPLTSLDGIEVEKIKEELFTSVSKEIRDEVNIPINHLFPPILLGVSYNPNTSRRPSLEFLVRCSLKTTQIQELYQQQTQSESEESTELIIKPLKTIIDSDIEELDIYNELTQPAQIAIVFLKVYFS